MGSLEDWKIGGLEDWKLGSLEDRKIGSLEAWEGLGRKGVEELRVMNYELALWLRRVTGEI